MLENEFFFFHSKILLRAECLELRACAKLKAFFIHYCLCVSLSTATIVNASSHDLFNRFLPSHSKPTAALHIWLWSLKAIFTLFCLQFNFCGKTKLAVNFLVLCHKSSYKQKLLLKLRVASWLKYKSLKFIFLVYLCKVVLIFLIPKLTAYEK